MQIGPSHDVLASVRCQRRQGESPKHPAEPDLDTDQLEAAAGCSGERNIGDPRQAPPRDVHDLSVEHVAHQPDFVRTQVGGVRTDCR